MPSAWPELDELIRALADVCALPRSEEEPSLSEATIAVGKATAELTRAAGSRGRAAAGARARAAMKAPTVAFPVACPVAECDGITSVEYPASAVDVNVDAVPA